MQHEARRRFPDCQFSDIQSKYSLLIVSSLRSHTDATTRSVRENQLPPRTINTPMCPFQDCILPPDARDLIKILFHKGHFSGTACLGGTFS